MSNGASATVTEPAAAESGSSTRQEGGISDLLTALATHDPETLAHSRDVAAMAYASGASLGIEGDDLVRLQTAALVHDVGKLLVPSEVLCKAGPLDEREWSVVKRHPAVGARLLAPLGGLGGVATTVLFHHERPDGKGYPIGLKDGEIPLASSIVSVCDAYHAMTSTRPYQRSIEPGAAAHELAAHAGTQFDARAVNAVLGVAAQRGRGPAAPTPIRGPAPGHSTQPQRRRFTPLR